MVDAVLKRFFSSNSSKVETMGTFVCWGMRHNSVYLCKSLFVHLQSALWTTWNNFTSVLIHIVVKDSPHLSVKFTCVCQSDLVFRNNFTKTWPYKYTYTNQKFMLTDRSKMCWSRGGNNKLHLLCYCHKVIYLCKLCFDCLKNQ